MSESSQHVTVQNQPLPSTDEPSIDSVAQPEHIVVNRETLERLVALLRRGYSRYQMREIKQAVDTMKHLLNQNT